MTDKQLKLAQKLKALAEKGIGGEKANADELLQKYLDKTGLTMDDIDSESIKTHYLNLGQNPEKARLFKQIIASVLGTEGSCYFLSKKELSGLKKDGYGGFSSKDYLIHYEATESERAEIMAKMDFYSGEYERQKDIFYIAFVQKNELYSNQERTKDADSLEDINVYELEKLYQMMRGIDKSDMRQRLKSPSYEFTATN